MKRLLLPLLAALALPTAVNAHDDQGKLFNKSIEAQADASISIICGANYNNWISDENVINTLAMIKVAHHKTYKGSLEDAGENFKKIYLKQIKQWPNCNLKDLGLEKY